MKSTLNPVFCQISPTALQPPVVVICGPTAVGKTASSLYLARSLAVEVVNADSMQVYRYLNIGTAKPDLSERTQVPHHLIDIIDPDQEFNAAAYARQARQVIEGLHRQARLPLVVGGSGLYIKALLHGLFNSLPSDSDVRDRLKQAWQSRGAAEMHRRLTACDPAAARRLHPNDQMRILRALEIYELTGQSITQLQQEHAFPPAPYRVLKLGLYLERTLLYQRINERVDLMLNQGLEAEVESLLARGYVSTLKSMQSIGYRHICACLEGRMTRKEAIQTLKRDTRRYAKRQLTWFQADPAVQWFTPDQLEPVQKTVTAFLTRK